MGARKDINLLNPLMMGLVVQETGEEKQPSRATFSLPVSLVLMPGRLLGWGEREPKQ